MIDNWANKSRPIDYSNLRFGSDIPSDLDGLMVLPSLTIAIEYKCGESPVRGMQRMVLETVVNDAEAAGKRAVAIVARYYDRDPSNIVNAAKCLVTETYTGGKWYEVRKCGMSLRRAMERLVWRETNAGNHHQHNTTRETVLLAETETRFLQASRHSDY